MSIYIETGTCPVHMVVFKVGGTVLGHVRLYEMHVWREGAYNGEKVGNIQDVWVHPDRRGRGLARKMMEMAHERARQVGCTGVRLTSRAERTVARKLYESLGYTITSDGWTLRFKKQEKEQNA